MFERKYSEADRAAIVELHRSGLTKTEIALKLGLPRTSVQSICDRAAGKRRRPIVAKRRRKITRKRYTQEEVNLLYRLVHEGLSDKEIARKLGDRTEYAIYVMRARIANKDLPPGIKPPEVTLYPPKDAPAAHRATGYLEYVRAAVLTPDTPAPVRAALLEILISEH